MADAVWCACYYYHNVIFTKTTNTCVPYIYTEYRYTQHFLLQMAKVSHVLALHSWLLHSVCVCVFTVGRCRWYLVCK